MPEHVKGGKRETELTFFGGKNSHEQAPLCCCFVISVFWFSLFFFPPCLSLYEVMSNEMKKKQSILGIEASRWNLIEGAISEGGCGM
jgi:hypothetical protein